jgi:hypothetical protein
LDGRDGKNYEAAVQFRAANFLEVLPALDGQDLHNIDCGKDGPTESLQE